MYARLGLFPESSVRGAYNRDMRTMRPTHDEECAVACTAEIIGGKWTALLVHDLSEGPRRFSDLERALPGISPRTLSERLRALEEEGILVRRELRRVAPAGRVRADREGRGAPADHRGDAPVRPRVARTRHGHRTTTPSHRQRLAQPVAREARERGGSTPSDRRTRPGSSPRRSPAARPASTTSRALPGTSTATSRPARASSAVRAAAADSGSRPATGPMRAPAASVYATGSPRRRHTVRICVRAQKAWSIVRSKP